MSEADFYRGITEDEGRVAVGAAYFQTMRKQASIAELGRRTAEFIGSHKQEIAGAMVGGALTATIGALTNRPGKSGLSLEQKVMRSAEAAQQQTEKDEALSGKTPGFLKKLTRVTTSGSRQVADVLAQHPVKAGLTMFPIGAAAGASIAAKLLK